MLLSIWKFTQKKKKKSRKSEFQIETIQNDKEMLNKGEENK